MKQWSEFVGDAFASCLHDSYCCRFDSLLSPEEKGRHQDPDSFWNVRDTVTSVVDCSLVRECLEAGKPGIVISSPDHSLEALSFALNNILNHCLDNQLSEESTNPESWHRGDYFSFQGELFQFDGVKDVPEFGQSIEYSSARQTSVCQSMSRITHPLNKCFGSNGAGPLKLSKHSLYELEREYIEDLCSFRFSSTSSLCYVSGSLRGTRGVSPTHLSEGLIYYKGRVMSLADLITIGKVSGHDLELKNRVNGKFISDSFAVPSIIGINRDECGAGDLFTVVQLAEESRKIRGVVLDLGDADQLDRHDLREVASLNIPVVIFCSDSTASQLDDLRESGYGFFCWSEAQIRDALQAAPKDRTPQLRLSQHKRLKSKLSLFVVGHENGCQQFSASLQRAKEGLAKLSESCVDFAPERQVEALRSLLNIISTIMKRTERYSSEQSAMLSGSISSLCECLLSDGWLSQEYCEAVEQIRADLVSLVAEGIVLPKEESVWQKLRVALAREERVCLVVPGKEQATVAARYWGARLEADGINAGRLSVLTPWELIKRGPVIAYELALIGGWYNHEVMEALLNSGLCDECWLCLYRTAGEQADLEVDWYNKAKERMDKAGKKRLAGNRSYLSTVGVSLPDPKSHRPLTSVIKQAKPSIEESDLASAIERLTKRSADTFEVRPGDQTVEARLVLFEEGVGRWFRVGEGADDGNHITVITDVLAGEEPEARSLTATQLSPGDVVLLPEVFGGALDIGSEAMSGVEAIARRWNTPIERQMKMGMSLSEAVKRITAAGCRKNPATIRKWVIGKEVMCPRSIEDLRCINKAFDEGLSEADLRVILEARGRCHGTRIATGKRVSGTLRELFSEDAKVYGAEDAARGFTRRHGDIGTVRLLTVSSIGIPAMVPLSRTNFYSGE